MSYTSNSIQDKKKKKNRGNSYKPKLDLKWRKSQANTEMYLTLNNWFKTNQSCTYLFSYVILLHSMYFYSFTLKSLVLKFSVIKCTEPIHLFLSESVRYTNIGIKNQFKWRNIWAGGSIMPLFKHDREKMKMQEKNDEK